MSENEIEKKIEESLLKINKKSLIDRLKEIENKLEVICSENNMDSFNTRENIKLETIEGNREFYIYIKKCKFIVVFANKRGFHENTYLLDDLIKFDYSPTIVKMLYEVYTKIPQIIESFINF